MTRFNSRYSVTSKANYDARSPNSSRHRSRFGAPSKSLCRASSRAFRVPCLRPPNASRLCEAVQGLYKSFKDRTQALPKVCEALTDRRHRGVAILGKGGFGKSALANRAIEVLSEDGRIDGVLYFSAEGNRRISMFDVFCSTMEACGRPRISYEGSWTAVGSAHRALNRAAPGVLPKPASGHRLRWARSGSRPRGADFGR